MTADKKTIDTLVEDIYKLFDPEKEVKISEEELEAFADGIKACGCLCSHSKEEEQLPSSVHDRKTRQADLEMNSMAFQKKNSLRLPTSSSFTEIYLSSF